MDGVCQMRFKPHQPDGDAWGAAQVDEVVETTREEPVP